MNRIILLIIVLLVSTTLFSQSDRDYIRRGNRYMRDTTYAKAQVQYQKAIEKDKSSSIAHFNLGNSFISQDNTEDGMKEYQKASDIETNKIRRSKIYHNMGVSTQSQKQLQQAVEHYRNALRDDPTNNETRYNYVLCLFQLKKNQSQSDNQDQQQDENGQDQQNQKDEQEQQKQDQQNDQKQEQKEQPDPEKMSKENAEQMLKAAMQDEKATQEKVQQAQQQPQDKRLLKQW